MKVFEVISVVCLLALLVFQVALPSEAVAQALGPDVISTEATKKIELDVETKFEVNKEKSFQLEFPVEGKRVKLLVDLNYPPSIALTPVSNEYSFKMKTKIADGVGMGDSRSLSGMEHLSTTLTDSNGLQTEGFLSEFLADGTKRTAGMEVLELEWRRGQQWALIRLYGQTLLVGHDTDMYTSGATEETGFDKTVRVIAFAGTRLDFDENGALVDYTRSDSVDPNNHYESLGLEEREDDVTLLNWFKSYYDGEDPFKHQSEDYRKASEIVSYDELHGEFVEIQETGARIYQYSNSAERPEEANPYTAIQIEHGDYLLQISHQDDEYPTKLYDISDRSQPRLIMPSMNFSAVETKENGESIVFARTTQSEESSVDELSFTFMGSLYTLDYYRNGSNDPAQSLNIIRVQPPSLQTEGGGYIRIDGASRNQDRSTARNIAYFRNVSLGSM